jgi:hypothetical protein
MRFFDLLKTKEKKQNNSKAIKLEDIFIDMKHGVKYNITAYQAYQAYKTLHLLNQLSLIKMASL